MASYLNDPAESFASRLAGLARRFPAVKAWRVRRDWSGRSARVEVALRRAAARLRRAGRPAGFLDEGGAVFESPAELYPEARLTVEAGGAGAEQLKGLPAVLEALARDAGLPAQVAFRSAYEGWEVRLQDGTQVLWGDLRWSREKLSRLHEALCDARAGGIGSSAGAGRTDLLTARAGPDARRSGASGPMLADLRYFEDGRVLLRPMMGNRTPTR
jgi:hypothetical protein